MIAGATGGRGGGALARHLADTKDMNESTLPGDSRGLVSEGIADQVRELTDIAAHARAAKPLHHVHADPATPWTDDQWAAWWRDYESEFGLERQPFAEAVHLKVDREHRHRVYSLVKPDGTCIRLSHDYARREKLARLAELRAGEVLTKGCYNRAAAAALDREGRAEAAAAMRAAGLTEGAPARALLTPAERHQQERTVIRKADVAASVLAAWRASDSGVAFLAALAEHGLRLAQGDRCPVILDASGNTYALNRVLNAATKAEGAARSPTGGIAVRLDGVPLPSLAEARVAMAPAPEEPPGAVEAPAAAAPPEAPPAHPTEAPATAGASSEPQAAQDFTVLHAAGALPTGGAAPASPAPPGPAPASGAKRAIRPSRPGDPEDEARFRREMAEEDERLAAEARAAASAWNES